GERPRGAGPPRAAEPQETHPEEEDAEEQGQAQGPLQLGHRRRQVGVADGLLEASVALDGDPHPRQHGQERQGADAEQRVPQAEVSEQPQHGRWRLYSGGAGPTSVSLRIAPAVAASATLAAKDRSPCAPPFWP